MLTVKGKNFIKKGKFFERKDFDNDDLCDDLFFLNVDPVDVLVEAGRAKTIIIKINRHVIAENEVLHLRAYSRYVQYRF